MQNRFNALLCGMLLALALTSCSTSDTATPVQATPAAVDPKVLAECGLLKEAMVRSAGNGAQNTQIVRGCPGYENVPDTSNRFSGAGSFLSAASTKVPAAALAKGKVGKILFQRMVIRGVPQNIATEMVNTPMFDQVVAAVK